MQVYSRLSSSRDQMLGGAALTLTLNTSQDREKAASRPAQHKWTRQSLRYCPIWAETPSVRRT
ncbi:hypothetical protein J6590_046716 [Homalodisca vitripennis]|nr:hypothetical protein J6590_046716 [Homalodisca vitripennis]